MYKTRRNVPAVTVVTACKSFLPTGVDAVLPSPTFVFVFLWERTPSTAVSEFAAASLASFEYYLNKIDFRSPRG